jgi:hypothetical protein
MNADIIFEVVLILLCMYFAYKWKQEQLKTEHLQDILKDKVGLLQTYKHLLDKRSKQMTRIQNESNKVHNLYFKLQKEREQQKKN